MHLSFREGGGVINMSYDAVQFLLTLISSIHDTIWSLKCKPARDVHCPIVLDFFMTLMQICVALSRVMPLGVG